MNQLSEVWHYVCPEDESWQVDKSGAGETGGKRKRQPKTEILAEAEANTWSTMKDSRREWQSMGRIKYCRALMSQEAGPGEEPKEELLED